MTTSKNDSSTLSTQQRREFIEFLLASGALQFGDFTTKSGRKTPYFVNTGRFDDGHKIATLGGWYAQAIAAMNKPIDTVFGPAYKGIPLAVATATALAAKLGKKVGYTFNRKEVKSHGDGGMFVGTQLSKGTRLVLVEDVITAGTTMREVLPMLRELGTEVVAVFVAVDRMEQGQNKELNISAVEEVRREFSIDVHPLITLLDVIEYVTIIPELANLIPAIEKYREQYGV